jgi:hypothetical protein
MRRNNHIINIIYTSLDKPQTIITRCNIDENYSAKQPTDARATFPVTSRVWIVSAVVTLYRTPQLPELVLTGLIVINKVVN